MKKGLQKQTQNNKVNGNRIRYINNYLKYKWIKCSNQKKQTGWLVTKTSFIYMLPTRDLLQAQGHIQTESEGMEEGIPCKWESEESWSSNTHIRQNGL